MIAILWSIRARILAGFLFILALQIGVAVVVRLADNAVESSSRAEAAARRVAELVARDAEVLRAMQVQLSVYLRTAAPNDLDAVLGSLRLLTTDAKGTGASVGEISSALNAVINAARGQRDRIGVLLADAARATNAIAAFAKTAAQLEDPQRMDTAAGFAADAEGPTIRAASFAVTLDPEEAAGTHTGINEAKAALQALVDDVASAIKSAGEQSDPSSAPAGMLTAGPRLIKHARILNLRLDTISSSIDDLRRAADARSAALAALDAAVGKARDVMETVVRRTDDERAMRAGEIAQARNRVDRTLLWATGLACIFGLALALVVGLSITRPIGRLAHAMRVVSDGTLDYDVPDTRRRDEIGAMARALRIFRDNMLRGRELAAAHERREAEIEAARQRAQAEAALSGVRERANRELRVQAVRFDAALNNMSQVLCMFDSEDHLIVGKERLACAFGLDADLIAPDMTLASMQVLLQSASKLQAEDARKIHDLIQRLRSQGKRGTQVLDLADNRSLAVHYASTEEEGWLVMLDDITEQRLVEAKIAHMAKHDALTGLANRVLFHERMSEAVVRSRRGERSAILCLDLDHFKAVNDTFGHPLGDGLLRIVTKRLLASVREGDTVARLGGDEFAIVQCGIPGAEGSTALAVRLIETVSAPYDIGGNRCIIGTSIGIAMIPDDGDEPDLLMKNADLALYQSKAEGRGCFRHFEAGMDARMKEKRALDLDLRTALEEGQFQVYYQPQVHIATRTVCGFEALVRWIHPERGVVAPSHFIPIAEENGLIVPLGAWVLRQALADAASWPPNIRVAVNLSPLQFGSDSLVEDVSEALAHSGLDPGKLELEITETAMLADTETVLATLQQIHDLGVGIALDDFGTGYSSLSYLRRFPFNKVKIDRSFVMDLGQQSGADTITAAIIDLCVRLGLRTTAEGVETEDQLERLANLHCTEAQGYLFNRPRPASDVPDMLNRPAAPPLEPIGTIVHATS